MRRKMIHALGIALALLGFMLSFVLAGGEELSPLGVIATEAAGIVALLFGAWMTEL